MDSWIRATKVWYRKHVDKRLESKTPSIFVVSECSQFEQEIDLISMVSWVPRTPRWLSRGPWIRAIPKNVVPDSNTLLRKMKGGEWDFETGIIVILIAMLQSTSSHSPPSKKSKLIWWNVGAQNFWLVSKSLVTGIVHVLRILIH